MPPNTASSLSSGVGGGALLAFGAGVLAGDSATGSDMYALAGGIGVADHALHPAPVSGLASRTAVVHAGPRSEPELLSYDSNGPDEQDVEMRSVNNVDAPVATSGLKKKKLTREWHDVTNRDMSKQTRTEAFLFQSQPQRCAAGNGSPPDVSSTLGSQPTSLAPVEVLCHLCNVSPALVRCETCQKSCAPSKAFYLCAECDARNHITNPLHQRYAQIALTWVPLLPTERVVSSTLAPIHMASHMQLNRTCPDCGSAIDWLVEDVTSDVSLTVIALDGSWDVHCATFVCNHPSLLSNIDATPGILVRYRAHIMLH